jgi:hypothetical protein
VSICKPLSLAALHGVSPISAQARNMLEEKVFAVYENLIGEPVKRQED